MSSTLFIFFLTHKLIYFVLKTFIYLFFCSRVNIAMNEKNLHVVTGKNYLLYIILFFEIRNNITVRYCAVCTIIQRARQSSQVRV